MTGITTACRTFRHMASEAKKEIVCLQTEAGHPFHSPSLQTATYTTNHPILCIQGEAITADCNFTRVDESRRPQRACACLGRCKMDIYDHPGVRLRLEVWMLKP